MAKARQHSVTVDQGVKDWRCLKKQHGNYNNDSRILQLCVSVIMYVFSEQTSGISLYGVHIPACAEVEQRTLYRYQPTISSWHSFSFVVVPVRNKRSIFHLFSRALNHRASLEWLTLIWHPRTNKHSQGWLTHWLKISLHLQLNERNYSKKKKKSTII